MEERTILADIETEKKKIVEEKLKTYASERTVIEQQKKDDFKTINIFSSSAFKNVQTEEPTIEEEPEEETEPVCEEETLTIDKPNYDFIETLSPSEKEKIEINVSDKEKEEASPKPKRSKFSIILLSVLFAIFGVWGIVNIVQINSLNTEIAQTSTEYSISLSKYLKNLYSLDATNSNNMENLFETIPDEEGSATEIEEESNWFDRFCNFIAGLFGG